MRKVLIAVAVFALLAAGVGAAAVVTEYHEWSVSNVETHTCQTSKPNRLCTVTDTDNYHGTITDEDTIPDPTTVTVTVTEPPTTTTEPPPPPPAPQCNDGKDNDGDTHIDYRTDGGGDPQCSSLTDDDEANDPPPPPPPPPPSGYPNEDNTGVVNEAALRYWPGHEPGGNPQPVYIDQPGQVIENYIFRRVVIVRNVATNVTFRNVRFKHNSDYYMLLSETSPGGNILVEDSEFDGMGAAQINAAVAGPGWTLKRVDIQGVQDAAKLHNNTNVYDSYIHNLWVTCDLGAGVPGDCEPHYDGLQSLGGVGNKIVHNTIDVGVGRGRNGAVFFRGYCPGGCESTIADILIEDNRLLGGGWTFACCGPEPNLIYRNFVLRNNKFGPYAYGPITTGGSTGIVSQCGNVWDETAVAVGKTPGDPLDAPC